MRGVAGGISPAPPKRIGALRERMGLLWLCLTDMLHWTDAKLRVQHDIVRQIEYATGHGHVAYVMTGPPRYMVDLAVHDDGVAAAAASKPNYTELSVTMGKSALDTADVKRRYEFMRRVCGDLAEAGTGGFADQAAVGLVRSQVEAQFLRAEYIAERARIQMSVVSRTFDAMFTMLPHYSPPLHS